jgi:hypothetical protein
MELKEKLKEILLCNQEYDSISYLKEEHPLIEKGLTIFCKEVKGGGEGDGEEHWVVMSVKDETGLETFWKVPGWYQSYDGAHLEIHNMFQVMPAKKTITIWVKP